MASQNLIPGLGFVNESQTKQNLVPGGGFVNETVSSGAVTGTFAAPTRRNTLDASGTVNPVTGTLAATTRRNTLDASGTVNPVTGTIDASTRRNVLDATGSVSGGVEGAFAASTRRNTLDATGIVDVVTGTFAATTRRNTLSASGISGEQVVEPVNPSVGGGRPGRTYAYPSEPSKKRRKPPEKPQETTSAPEEAPKPYKVAGRLGAITDVPDNVVQLPVVSTVVTGSPIEPVAPVKTLEQAVEEAVRKAMAEYQAAQDGEKILKQLEKEEAELSLREVESLLLLAMVE